MDMSGNGLKTVFIGMGVGVYRLPWRFRGWRHHAVVPERKLGDEAFSGATTPFFRFFISADSTDFSDYHFSLPA
jgi:hypothetical protein